MALGLLVDAAVTEKFPSEYISPVSSRVAWTLLAILTVPVVFALYWIWWKANVKDMKTIPTSGSNNHVVIAFVIFMAFFRNRLVDTNVLFFQLLRGMTKIHMQMGYGLFYLWTGLRPVVICFRSDFFEAILKSPTNLKKSFDYSFISLWLKEGLVTSHGSKWKNRRKALTSTFHYKILEDFVLVFDDQSRVFINRLKTTLSQDWVNVVPYVTMCTLDIICETAMGIRINAQVDQDNAYLKAMHKVCEAFVSRVMRPWLWPSWIFFSTKQGKEFKKNASIMDDFTRQVIREKKKDLMARKIKDFASDSSTEIDKKKKNNKKALLDLLLELHLDDPKGFTETDIQEEVDSFMFAGHDTTASSTSWALYLLGLHPDIQAKVQDEMDLVFGDDVTRPVTEEDLRQLKYLDCVIKETQRIYAPAPYIGRELEEDVTLNGITIPKGTTCMLLIYMLHRDEKVFPNPEVFDPDRFMPCNTQDRHPYAYCPFSGGLRSCIGQRFAFLEEKVILSNFFRHFSIISLDERDKIQMTAEMVLRSRKGIRLKIIPRDIQ